MSDNSPEKILEENSVSQWYWKGDLRYPVLIVELLPISKMAWIMFKGGKNALVRQDQLEGGPTQEEIKDKKRTDF